MFTTLHWEGKLSNLMYHNNSHFFFCSWDKWPFRFVALKFKCTNINKQSACSVLCFVKGGRAGWKRWRVGDMKKTRKLSFWGAGMGEERKQPYCGSSNIYFKLWQKVNAWNIGFETLYSGQTMLSTRLVILNYPVILFHRCSTTVSSEPYPLNIFQTVLHMCSTSEKVRIYFNHKPKKHFILMI